MPSTVGLKEPWRPGQSGNPAGRKPGTTPLRTMMKRRDAQAWETFDHLLTNGGEEMRARMFVLYLSFRFRETPEAAQAARRIVDGTFTEAELVAMEEKAKLYATNEEQ